MVPQKFQMKDLLKGFQGVMNFAMFRWIFDPLQTFQKSAIFIALMVIANYSMIKERENLKCKNTKIIILNKKKKKFQGNFILKQR